MEDIKVNRPKTSMQVKPALHRIIMTKCAKRGLTVNDLLDQWSRKDDLLHKNQK